MSSRAFSIVIMILLALSLGVKAAATSADPSPNHFMTLTSLRSMLDDAGFDAQIRHLQRSPGLLVEATSEECGIVGGEYPVHDTFLKVYQKMAQPRDRLIFAYRGLLYEHPPKARSMLDYFIWRELRRVGISHQRTPVFALTVSPKCDLRHLLWGRIAFVDE
jgi:hypothetical protein